MDLEKLYKILNDCTRQLRKGDTIEGSPALVDAIKRGDENLPGGKVEIYAMPPAADADAALEKIDLEFIVIGVDRTKAEARRSELLAILAQYPEPERLAGGPSYIEVGAVIGDQGAAFQLFALGEVLGLWRVITPTSLGMPSEKCRELAGQGLIMMSGFSSKEAA